jgi:hypothetical protein
MVGPAKVGAESHEASNPQRQLEGAADCVGPGAGRARVVAVDSAVVEEGTGVGVHRDLAVAVAVVVDVVVVVAAAEAASRAAGEAAGRAVGGTVAVGVAVAAVEAVGAEAGKTARRRPRHRLAAGSAADRPSFAAVAAEPRTRKGKGWLGGLAAADSSCCCFCCSCHGGHFDFGTLRGTEKDTARRNPARVWILNFSIFPPLWQRVSLLLLLEPASS